MSEPLALFLCDFFSAALDQLQSLCRAAPRGWLEDTIAHFVVVDEKLLDLVHERWRHIQRRNLRQEMITEEELIEELREQGVESVEEVKKSYLEGDGRISVITKNSKNQKEKTEKKPIQ